MVLYYYRNAQMVKDHNAEFATGAVTYEMELNQFSDMVRLRQTYILLSSLAFIVVKR